MTPSQIVKTVLGGIVGIFVLSIVFGTFGTIPSGFVGVKTQFGKVIGTVSPGFYVKTPFIQEVIKLDVQKQKEQIDATAASQDLQNVSATVAVNYILNASDVGLLWANIGEDYKVKVMDPAIQESIKASTAKYTAEQLIGKREEARQVIEDLLKEKLKSNYITVTEVSIVNFKFSSQFEQAIELKVTAEQNALAAKNKLAQVQYEAQQRVAEAEGEAKAIQIQAQAINSQGGADYVQLQAIKQWKGEVPQYMMSGAVVPFINLK